MFKLLLRWFWKKKTLGAPRNMQEFVETIQTLSTEIAEHFAQNYEDVNANGTVLRLCACACIHAGFSAMYCSNADAAQALGVATKIATFNYPEIEAKVRASQETTMGFVPEKPVDIC